MGRGRRLAGAAARLDADERVGEVVGKDASSGRPRVKLAHPFSRDGIKQSQQLLFVHEADLALSRHEEWARSGALFPAERHEKHLTADEQFLRDAVEMIADFGKGVLQRAPGPE